MPVGYDKLRLRMATQGMDHENTVNILENKIRVLGGMNYISVDNINKANRNRSENFNKFISSGYPYIKTKTEEEGTGSNGLDSLVKEYYKIFGKPEKNENAANTTVEPMCPLTPPSNNISGGANDGLSTKQLPKIF
jgi:hypothetical protein